LVVLLLWLWLFAKDIGALIVADDIIGNKRSESVCAWVW